MEETRFVVGVDGSAESREALRWASRLANVLGGEIVVVHALGLLEHSRGPEIRDVVEREWCAGLGHNGTPFRVVVRDGCAVDVLVAVAREERASLLVVGSRGIGAAPALALGSTSLYLLQVAPAPVLVVPRREEGSSHLSLRRILVGVDTTKASERAVDEACRLAEVFGAWIDLVNAVEDVPVFPLGPSTRVTCEGEISAPHLARRRLERLRRRISARGLPVHVRVERGAPHEVVRATAASIDADLVVVGSAHVGDPTEPLLGESVSRSVVSVAHRPTLVVPAPASRPLRQTVNL